MKTSAIHQDLLATAVNKLPDNGLRGIRADALTQFALTGLPDVTNEDWRYTNLKPAIELSNEWLRGIKDRGTVPAGTSAGMSPQDFQVALDARWLRILNGRLLDAPNSQEKTDGILVSTSAPEADLDTEDGIASFNAALMHDVIRIRVPADIAVSQPVGLIIASDASGSDRVSATRVVLEAGKNSVIDVIENHVSVTPAESYANVVIELHLAKGAHVNFLRLQECGESQLLTGKLVVILDDDATFNYSSIDLGGALVRNDVIVDIRSPGANVLANGVYLAGGAQHIDNHLRVDHRKGPARSKATFRGILNDNARCVFNSKAIVHVGADGTDAAQSNHNLMLSDKAEIDTKPELEIYAEDVKCAHGATVGQLDQTALFYLRSRGIDEANAARMLTRAFAAMILGDLSVPVATTYVARRVDTRLDKMIGDAI